MDMQERWATITRNGSEHAQFSLVDNKRALRPDLHAFLLLDELFPVCDKCRNIVRCSEHEQIWLDVSVEQIETLTDAQILELSRCGVAYDSAIEQLYMFP